MKGYSSASFSYRKKPLQLTCLQGHSVPPVGRLACEQSTSWQEAVLLNLDETAVGYSMLGVKGFFKKKLVKRKNVGAHIRKKDLRGTITHVAVIADRPDVQAVLPQVFIGSTHRFTLGLTKSAAAAAKPANVSFISTQVVLE